MTTTQYPPVPAVRKSITVETTPEHAFQVFTDGIDSWWPHGRHIGTSPMKRAVIEGRPGGRCYSEQVDGTECDWGSILKWDPPHAFVLAWQVSPQWQYEPDLAKASEVEVRFTPEGPGSTRVDLEHRHFERHGVGYDALRTSVDHPDGWNGLLLLFQSRAQQSC